MENSTILIINSLVAMLLPITLFRYRKAIYGSYSYSDKGYYYLWVILTLFSVFYIPIGGDSESTLGIFENYHANGTEYHLEEMYFRLMDILPNNYYLWRLVIWGTASFFTVLTVKKLHIDSGLASVAMVCVCLIPIFYYVRNILGLSILFYLVVRIYEFKKQDKKSIVRECLVCVPLLVLSYFAHSSMPLYYAICLAAFFVPLGWTTYLALGVIFIAISFFPDQIVSLLLASGLFMDYAYDASSKVFEADQGFLLNSFGQFLRTFWLFPYGALIVYGLIVLRGKDFHDEYAAITKVFLVISTLLFFGSFALSGTIVYSLYYRLLNSSFFSLAFFVMLFLRNRRTGLISKVFMTLILIYNIYQYFAIIKF